MGAVRPANGIQPRLFLIPSQKADLSFSWHWCDSRTHSETLWFHFRAHPSPSFERWVFRNDLMKTLILLFDWTCYSLLGASALVTHHLLLLWVVPHGSCSCVLPKKTYSCPIQVSSLVQWIISSRYCSCSHEASPGLISWVLFTILNILSTSLLTVRFDFTLPPLNTHRMHCVRAVLRPQTVHTGHI